MREELMWQEGRNNFLILLVCTASPPSSGMLLQGFLQRIGPGRVQAVFQTSYRGEYWDGGVVATIVEAPVRATTVSCPRP